VFAVSDAEKKSGRDGAANKDVKFMSQEGEWFLAGVLDGIADGTHMFSVEFGFLAD
jgi:glutamine synthetase